MAVSGLDTEQPRYYLQHALGSQAHDIGPPTDSGGTAEPTSDGRTGQSMADWTDLTYAVVDLEGNGQ